jgi:8-oxo-dGTP pyrophosphatase MutT (NUDIX family)
MSKQADPSQRRSRAAALAGPGQPPRLQVGALCWRRTTKGAVRVLLITSRDTGRWVIPKGWPMRNRSDADAAAREAYEEAGVTGAVHTRPLGLYGYPKVMGLGWSIPCVVRVFPLQVREMLRHYPETGQRRVKWFHPAKAARKVREPDLARLLREFDPSAIEREETVP